MNLSHIIAMSENRVIGKDNQLPWHLPADLKFFKEKTNNHIILMGRKTFESIKKPLPNRYHIVITRAPPTTNLFLEYKNNNPVVYVESIDKALLHSQSLTKQWGEEVFLIGGGEIFKQSIAIIDTIYLTVIHKNIEGDVFYPEFNTNSLIQFELTENIDHNEPMPFSFQTWKRIRGD